MRLILVAALMLPLIILGQSKKPSLPSFGKVDKTELTSNTCDFDKNAEAMVLFDVAKRRYDIFSGHPNSELKRHVRMKILSEKGKDHADVEVLYFNEPGETILGIDAQTYNVDDAGNIVVSPVKKDAIFFKKVNKDFSQVSFTFPDVKPGSIIEYKYVHRGYKFRSKALQGSLPVKYSYLELDYPRMFEVYAMPFCSLPYSSTDESTTLRTVKVFSMENIPALRDEEYITCDGDYLQRVESWVTAYYDGDNRRQPLLKTWPEYAKLLLDDEEFGRQVKKDISGADELQLLLKAASGAYQKMSIIHNYVRNNINWNGENSFFASNGVRSVFKEKSGNSGEINLLLVNLLQHAGLDAKPMLVSTRDNGRVSPLYTRLNQFNKVLAHVTIDEKVYVLDGTDKVTPACIIPFDVNYSEGLLLDEYNPNKFSWFALWDEKRQDKNVTFFRAEIDEEFGIKGHATISSSDYGRLKRVPLLKDREKFLERFVQHTKYNLSVDSFYTKNEKVDTLPLVQEFDFKGTLNSSGEYSYFNINLFGGMAKNPFISDSRFSDVFFGVNQTHTIISNVRIPEGCSFEELPKNLRLTLEDQSLVITRMVSATGNMVNSKITLEFKKPYYTPEEYADLKEFYKKMFALLDEQIVFKKNS